MKKYIVQWKNNEKDFADVQEAVKFAEKTGETGVNAYVWVELDGVRDEEPFFECVWTI
jgi:hypothetical protein